MIKQLNFTKRLLLGCSMLMAFMFLAVFSANAQVNAYAFSPGAGGTLDPMTGSTQLTGTGSDDGAGALTNIGFTFNYGGTNYTQFSTNVNGNLRLGASTTTGSTYYTNTAANAGTGSPLIFPYYDDLATGSAAGGGKVHYLLTGTAPNRILKVEWFVTVPRATSGAANARFQCWLNETTNIIQFIYGTGTAINTTNSGYSVGLASSSTVYQTITTATNTSSSASFQSSQTNAITAGTTYTFTPPVPCTGTPTPGTIPATAGVCSGGTAGVTLVASGFSSGVTGIAFQWEESDDNGVGDAWTNAVGGTGATTATYTSPVLASSIFYRCNVTCTPSTLFDYTNSCAVSVTNCTFDVAKSANTYSSIAGTGTSMTGTWRNTNTNTDDNMSATQPLGFNFTYKGNTYSNFAASTSGFITFNVGTSSTGSGTGAYGYSNGALSASSSGSYLTLAPFYEDLVTPGNPGTLAGLNGAIKYQLDGSAPNRVATIEWVGMETFGNAGPNLNFQVKLYETTNVIEYVYGTMELFNGTQNFSYTYSMGLNGSAVSATPTAIELQTQQVANVQNFASTAANTLAGFMDCNVKYTFTPGTYSGASSAPALSNDEYTTATSLSVNATPCVNLCGTYYRSAGATASASIPVCTATTAGTPDDDVWFSFVATTTGANIVVRGAGGYDAVVQLFDNTYASLNCSNTTLTGLSETVTNTTLTIGQTYYVRVYHSGAGNGSTPEFSICVSEIVPPPANDNICGATTLTVAGTCVTTTGNTITATASPEVVCGGTADDDVWYSFVASTSADLVTVQSAAGFNAHLQVFSSSDNTCTGTLTSLGCINNTSTAGAETFTGSGLVAGNTYFIRVYHSASGAGTGSFTICVTATAPSCVANPTSPLDAGTACDGSSITLSWPVASGATSYDVVLDGGTAINVATNSYVAGVLALGAHTWSVTPINAIGAASGCNTWTFDVQAPATAGTASGPATLFTSQSGSYSETGTGGTIQWQSSTTAGGPYTNISGANASTSSITFVAPGTYYIVAVRSVGGCTDAVSNEITTVVTVQGDLPCDAIALAIGSNGPYSNAGATGDGGEVSPPLIDCNGQTGWCASSNTVINSIWGSFVAPASGRVSIESPGFDTQLGLYSATDCSDYLTYTLIAANDDNPDPLVTNFSSKITATCLTPGATYLVKLDGYQSTVGSTNINITDEGNTPPVIEGCPSNVSVNTACDGTSAMATWTAPTASDDCPGITIFGSHASGDVFPIGTTTVTYTTNDGINPAVTCSFDVIVTGITSTSNSTTATACDSYMWSVDGMAYIASGTYTATSTNAAGCPHTETLNLTINASPVVTAGDVSGCPGSSIMLSGMPAGGTFSVANPYTGPTTTYTYSYTDANGCSATSASATITVTALNPVAGLTFSAITGNTAVATWNPVSGAAWYTIRYRVLGTSTWSFASTSGTATTTTLTGLIANTEYEVEIRSNCSATSPGNYGSNTSFLTGASCPTPTGIVVSNVTKDKATITWTPAVGAGWYNIRYRIVGASTWIVASVGLGATATLSGLTPSSQYEFQVLTKCSSTNVSGWSAVDNFTTLAMKQDVNVTAETFVANVTVYPNPVHDILNIDITATEAQSTSVKVFDMSGRLVKQIQANTEIGASNLTINMSDVASGLYTVQVYANDKLSNVSRINKQD